MADVPLMTNPMTAVADTIIGGTAGAPTRLKNNLSASVAPAVTDDSGDGYAIGSRWIDTTADKEYVALDVTVGAAVWTETTGAGSALTAADTSAGGDTTIVNANTYYDGPNTGALAAGTWLILWKCIVSVTASTSQNYDFQSRVWDGTTTYDEAQTGPSPTGNMSGESFTMDGACIVVLGSPATLKVSAACNRGSSATKIARNIAVNSATSNLPTRIIAVKIA